MILKTIYDGLIHSDVPNIIQVVSGFVALYALRKFNCVEPRCWRIARHTVKGTTYHTCSKHATPDIHARIFEDHKAKRPDQHALLNGPDSPVATGDDAQP